MLVKEDAIVHVNDAIKKLSSGGEITSDDGGMYNACRNFYGLSRSEQGYRETRYKGKGFSTIKDCREEISDLQSLIAELEKCGFSKLDYKWVEVEIDAPLI